MIRTILSAVRDGGGRLTDCAARSTTYLKRHLFQHYGFCSRPLPGAHGILLKAGLNDMVVVATEDNRYRVALEEGEVALYDNYGSKVHLKNGGDIEISCSGKVTINGNFEVSA